LEEKNCRLPSRIKKKSEWRVKRRLRRRKEIYACRSGGNKANEARKQLSKTSESKELKILTKEKKKKKRAGQRWGV